MTDQRTATGTDHGATLRFVCDALCLALVLSLVSVTPPLSAQPTTDADVSRYTVDGGGGASADGNIVEAGTIGQPCAGGPMSGGRIAITSGFWFGASAEVPPVTRTARPTLGVTATRTSVATPSNTPTAPITPTPPLAATPTAGTVPTVPPTRAPSVAATSTATIPATATATGTVTRTSTRAATPTATPSPANRGSTLQFSITGANKSAAVADIVSFGRSGVVQIDDELVGFVGTSLAVALAIGTGPPTGQPGTLLNLMRGIDGTVAASHAVGARVVFVAPLCTGDCNGDASVTIDELVRGINIVLGRAPLQACIPFDASADGEVKVSELVEAVAFELKGCPSREASTNEEDRRP